MRTLLIAHATLGLLALLVVGFVAYPYRGRGIPKAGRLGDRVIDLRDRVDPGEAPPEGVLSTPEKSRAMAERFERAESTVRRVVTPGPHED
ncbi:MAG TPA: hypothetical protein VH857_04035 [Actinomycetes bacterium]|nr:hypothetical protein [Actinomycetes bacterium]